MIREQIYMMTVYDKPEADQNQITIARAQLVIENYHDFCKFAE